MSMDGRHLDAALARLRNRTGVSVAFGGPVTAEGGLLLSRFSGPTAGVLSGLRVSLGEGLGGRVVALQRPGAVNDYFEARAITHRYDELIRAEGIRAVVASPVVVRRNPIAVIYGAYRGDEVVGDRVQDLVVAEAKALEQQIVAAETLSEARETWTHSDTESGVLRQQMREAHAKLREVMRLVDDGAVRDALEEIGSTLSHVSGDGPAADQSVLTPRESEVLTLAGLGYSNARIAESLGLTLHTVKSYMKSAMAKLNAHSRHEAVVAARRDQLII